MSAPLPRPAARSPKHRVDPAALFDDEPHHLVSGRDFGVHRRTAYRVLAKIREYAHASAKPVCAYVTFDGDVFVQSLPGTPDERARAQTANRWPPPPCLHPTGYTTKR